MTAISANKLDAYIQNLTSRISTSVENIKSGRAGRFTAGNVPDSQGSDSRFNVAGNVFSFGVSYLEPNMLSAVQRFVQEADAGKMRENRTHREQVEGEENLVAQKAENLPETDMPDFAEALDSVFADKQTQEVREGFKTDSSAAEKTVRTYSSAVEGISAGYVSSAYDYVFNINNRPQIKIEFMHKYNRNFDYTI